jgi:putative peptide zinc metalloprotease protein
MPQEASKEVPRLRRDLIVSRQVTRGETLYVVKDPASTRFFKLGPFEYSIARQLDGTRPLEGIRRSVEAESGAVLHPRTLEQFLERLGRLGLLEGPAARDREVLHQRNRRGSLLYYRFGAFDPGRLLDRLAGWTRPFFTPYFVTASVLLVLLAVWITLAHGGEIARDIVGLWRLQSLALAYVIVLLVITAHEFAHGLTCRHFGGRVQEMGFILIYFQPTFYCNVSDAWLFPKKSQRLWVTFVGAWFELFLWALATLTWRVMEPASWPARLALIIMATSGIRTLFNLNPLIKLDGYYLLSDWLEIPNLRWKAFSYLRSRLHGPLGWREQGAPRERRIYVVYGVLAFAYSFFLLTLITRYMGGHLVRRYQGWGFLLFALLLGIVLRAPLAGALRGVSSMFSVSRGLKQTAVRLAKLLAVGVPLALVLFLGRLELKVSGEFTILPAQNADVRAEVDGIIQQIYVEEGTTVRKGDPIARLSDRDYRSEASKTRAEIEEKEAVLRMVQAGPRAEEIQLARTSVEKAEERLVYAKTQLERLEPLYGEKVVSVKELEDVREQVGVRQKEIEEARGRLDVLLAGSRPEEIEALEAEIARLTTQKRYLAGQLLSVNLASPIDGVVASRNLKEKVGEAVKKGDLIAKVHELDTVTAEIAVPEREISDVQMGQRVVLRARAHPETTFEGSVVSIAPMVTKPDEARLERTLVVTTRLDNPEHLLKSEMTGNAKIYCGERRAVDVVMRRIQRYIRVEFWSWW